MLVCLLFVYYFAATMVNKRLSHRSRLQSAASGSAMREKLAASSRRRHLRRRHLDYPLRAVSGHFDVRQSVRPPARPPARRSSGWSSPRLGRLTASSDTTPSHKRYREQRLADAEKFTPVASSTSAVERGGI